MSKIKSALRALINSKCNIALTKARAVNGEVWGCCTACQKQFTATKGNLNQGSLSLRKTNKSMLCHQPWQTAEPLMKISMWKHTSGVQTHTHIQQYTMRQYFLSETNAQSVSFEIFSIPIVKWVKLYQSLFQCQKVCQSHSQNPSLPCFQPDSSLHVCT